MSIQNIDIDISQIENICTQLELNDLYHISDIEIEYSSKNSDHKVNKVDKQVYIGNLETYTSESIFLEFLYTYWPKHVIERVKFIYPEEFHKKPHCYVTFADTHLSSCCVRNLNKKFVNNLSRGLKVRFANSKYQKS